MMQVSQWILEIALEIGTFSIAVMPGMIAVSAEGSDVVVAVASVVYANCVVDFFKCKMRVVEIAFVCWTLGGYGFLTSGELGKVVILFVNVYVLPNGAILPMVLRRDLKPAGKVWGQCKPSDGQ
jgi:hypothetical protein